MATQARVTAVPRGAFATVVRAPENRRLLIGTGGVTVLVGGWLVTGVGGPMVSQTVSNVALCAAALAAAVACLGTARRHTGRMRCSWALIGLGTLSWGAGQMCWTWYESIRGDEVPFPSFADIGYLGMPALTVAGLLTLPAAVQSVANRFRSVLDGLMIGCSLLLASWVMLIGPAISAGADSDLALLISLSYPLGDLVIVTVVVFSVARRRQGGSVPIPLALVGTGIVTFAVADSGFFYLNLIGAYSSGAVIDLGWFVGFTFIMLAARLRGAAPDETGPVEGSSRQFAILLPYVAVLAALATSMFENLRHGHSGGIVFWTRSAMILLIVGRQVLTLLENRTLTRDLEARVLARTAELLASEQRFHALVQHSSDVVTVVDTGAVVIYQSESVTRVFGHQPLDLTGTPLTALLGKADGARLLRTLGALASQPYGTAVLELDVHDVEGRVRHAEMTITNLLDDPSVHGLVLNTRDISDSKQLQEQLVHEAFHDALTQLPNRALFKDRLDRALRRRQPNGSTVTVLFLDLDGFKEVNDSLGHAAGDDLLIRVAERLRTAVRPEDTVARFGGDEFAVLLETTGDSAAAEALATRIMASTNDPFLIDAHELRVRASIGIATAGPDAGDTDQLMRNADLAMYQAKAMRDGGFVTYDPTMHTGLVERLQLEADLRRAVEAGEFVLHYQPTVELSTGAAIGFEALVRWQHPTRGLVAPAEFIPLAEATGLIRPLGQWVLTEACRQAAAWVDGDEHLPLVMSVNVSGRQFDKTDLPSVVSAVLADTGLRPDRLCLEMTESVLMTDTEDNLTLLQRLKQTGVKLAIDDFGTGYSSLSYLGKFPVDTLKIDRSFVERLGDLPDDATLARTIVQLGQSLGLSTVAEGIEHYAQFLALRRMGCELAQGHYFSQPVPAAEAVLLLGLGGASDESRAVAA